MIITCYVVLFNPPEKECRLGVAVCSECIRGAVLSTGKMFSQSTMVRGSPYSRGLSTQRHQGDLRSLKVTAHMRQTESGSEAFCAN